MGYYYPGTKHVTTSGHVKVLITADATRDLVASPRTGLTVRDLATGKVWELPDNRATRGAAELS